MRARALRSRYDANESWPKPPAMALRSICVSVKKLSEKPLPASAQPTVPPPFLLAQYSIPKSPPAALRARRQARARGLQARRWQACGLVGTPRLQRARSPASRIASQQGGPPGAVCRTARSACGARELRARGEAQSLRPGGAVRPFTVPLATPSRSSARARAAIEFFR